MYTRNDFLTLHPITLQCQTAFFNKNSANTLEWSGECEVSYKAYGPVQCEIVNDKFTTELNRYTVFYITTDNTLVQHLYFQRRQLTVCTRNLLHPYSVLLHNVPVFSFDFSSFWICTGDLQSNMSAVSIPQSICKHILTAFWIQLVNNSCV